MYFFLGEFWKAWNNDVTTVSRKSKSSLFAGGSSFDLYIGLIKCIFMFFSIKVLLFIVRSKSNLLLSVAGPYPTFFLILIFTNFQIKIQPVGWGQQLRPRGAVPHAPLRPRHVLRLSCQRVAGRLCGLFPAGVGPAVPVSEPLPPDPGWFQFQFFQFYFFIFLAKCLWVNCSVIIFRTNHARTFGTITPSRSRLAFSVYFR